MENQNFFVCGKPGSGKSTYLKNQILSDIERRDRAVIYIEPHGEDSIDLLNQIPRDRIRDVCYLDCSDLEYAVAFNPLDAPHRLVSALRTIFKDSWGPRLEQFLRNGLGAIFEANLTLQALPRLYYSKPHRSKALKKVRSRSTRAFWTDLYPKAFNDRQQQEAASPIYNKLDAILSSAIAHNLTQAHPRLDLREAIERRMIVVVNLSTPTIGEDAATVLGSLFTTTFRNTLMSYPGPASFYADEFQVYGTDVYLSMLRELRKFGLKLGLSTQTTQGMDPAFLSTILATVRDTILFQLSFEDAEILSKPFNTEGRDITATLANLPPFTAFVNGERQEMPPFRGDRASFQKIRTQSRERFARPRRA